MIEDEFLSVFCHCILQLWELDLVRPSILFICLSASPAPFFLPISGTQSFCVSPISPFFPPFHFGRPFIYYLSSLSFPEPLETYVFSRRKSSTKSSEKDTTTVESVLLELMHPRIQVSFLLLIYWKIECSNSKLVVFIVNVSFPSFSPIFPRLSSVSKNRTTGNSRDNEGIITPSFFYLPICRQSLCLR